MRMAQVLAMGGAASTASAVARTAVGDHLWDAADERWWAGVLRWLVQQGPMEPASIILIVEYLQHRRYGDGHSEPSDPAFMLPGRSLRAVLGLAEAWQSSQAQPAQDEAAFPRSTLVPGCWEIHGETWTVTQIRDSAALRQEGEAMRHCVARYTRTARRGGCSFWSMRRRDGRRAVTVRVDHDSLITERRGRCNRALTEVERDVLRRWADLNGLGIRT
jgi:hypothetical protein